MGPGADSSTVQSKQLYATSKIIIDLTSGPHSLLFSLLSPHRPRLSPNCNPGQICNWTEQPCSESNLLKSVGEINDAAVADRYGSWNCTVYMQVEQLSLRGISALLFLPPSPTLVKHSSEDLVIKPCLYLLQRKVSHLLLVQQE